MYIWFRGQFVKFSPRAWLCIMKCTRLCSWSQDFGDLDYMLCLIDRSFNLIMSYDAISFNFLVTRTGGRPIFKIMSQGERRKHREVNYGRLMWFAHAWIHVMSVKFDHINLLILIFIFSGDFPTSRNKLIDDLYGYVDQIWYHDIGF